MITQEFENRIKSKRLTQVEQVVAEYILHNFHTVGFMTTTDIANELNISDASVFRTARSLGYNGFEELKTEIKIWFQNNFRPQIAFVNTVNLRRLSVSNQTGILYLRMTQ